MKHRNNTNPYYSTTQSLLHHIKSTFYKILKQLLVDQYKNDKKQCLQLIQLNYYQKQELVYKARKTFLNHLAFHVFLQYLFKVKDHINVALDLPKKVQLL